MDTARDVNTAVEEIQNTIKAKPQPPNPTPTAPTNSLSYTAAVATGAHLTPTHISTLAWGDAWSRQVLVDKAPGAISNSLEDLWVGSINRGPMYLYLSNCPQFSV